MRPLLVPLLVLLIVPGWSGEERLPLPGAEPEVTSRPAALHPGDPRVRRTGRLRFLGGVELSSDDPGFGGYSALRVEGDRFTLLGDGGNLLTFRMGSDRRLRDVRLFPLPAGPGTGWTKLERDAEALTHDPRTGRWWVAFERYDAVWRYAPGFSRAERGRRPAAMRSWRENGGPEAMARLGDGRFVLIGEKAYPPRGADGGRPPGRMGLIFVGDPTDPRVRSASFIYRPADGHHPVDMVELPDGRVLVLERGFGLPFRWRNRLAVVERGAIRPGAVVSGAEVGRLGAPLVADNFEGVSAARENGRTVLWIVSDDNELTLQRTLLLKFELEG